MQENMEIELNIDTEFWEDFIQEAFEHIEEIEMNVLTLEKEPENEEIIHTMFRAFHTIKGLSGFVEHTVIQEIAHKTETLMDFCRKGEMKVSKTIVDAILKSADFIRRLCEDLDACQDKAYVGEIFAHIHMLETLAYNHENGITAEPEISAKASEKVEPVEELPVKKEEILLEITESVVAKVEQSEYFEIVEEKEEIVFSLAEEELVKAEETEKEEIKEKKVEPEVEKTELKTEKTEKKSEEKPVEKPVERAIEAPKVEPAKVEASKPEPVVAVAETPKEAASANKKPLLEEYMKVANSKIDHLVEMIGELIINQSLIDQYVATNYSHDNQFITNMGGLSRTTRELQDLSMFLRMVALKPTFQKLTRIARDTIQELTKDVDFITVGETTEIDRIVADKLLEPLVHLIKNAISHGVEPDPKDRVKNGKPAKAKVELIAYNKRGSIYIEIKDDGRGINTDVVYKKALEKGLIDPNREYTDEEIKEFILLPGFSTAEKVDNISGRGVGMDVVKTQILKIGGKIDIKSELGKGSVFTLKIPVNHAIMNGTVIDMLGQHFIVPTLNVKEILLPKDNQWIYTQQQRTMLRVRESIVPIAPISMLFKDMYKEEHSPLVLLLESEGEFRALPITNVLNRQEVVVKPVGEEFSNLKYISGMSILGNGRVSLILDVDYLFTMEVKE